MNALTEATSEAGTVTREQLSSIDLGFETRRLIDQSRGIWNPRDLQATLSVLSTPSGPYDDEALDGSVFRYDYRAGSTDGDNRKLRRAFELGMPIILLRKVEAGAFLPSSLCTSSRTISRSGTFSSVSTKACAHCQIRPTPHPLSAATSRG